ncbi:MAG TPA: hypothetical protein VEU08_05745 [Vicinamibacterales bacterium]|nr:hypothetical protein [Vicinamibacterales bacterium]
MGAHAAARDSDVLQSIAAVPAHIAGQFREAVGFQQADSGEYFVFDRRAHAVFGIDDRLTKAWEIVKIGAEPGRIIDPTAFAVDADGTFAVADAPNNRERIQIFSAAGSHITGFMLPGRVLPRVMLNTQVLSGIGSMQYTGKTILISQPETGALITEYALNGTALRSIGRLRASGHEDDREVHLALNTGVPLADADGGFWFVFQAGVPMLQRYDRDGRLLFERHIEGREIDAALAAQPTTWPKRRVGEGLLPVVTPIVRCAAIDRAGRLWIALVSPHTYVFDRDGDKIRTVQFRAAGLIAPDSLFFTKSGRILVTPGLYEFADGDRAGGAGKAGGQTDLPTHQPYPPHQPYQPYPPPRS